MDAENGDAPARKLENSRSLEDEREYLRAEVNSGRARLVILDPDGSWNPWVMAVVRLKTGIVYETQCAGTGCDQRYIEGMLVPLGGFRVVHDHGQVDTSLLTAVFHEGQACTWSWCGKRLPKERLEALRSLIEDIPYWHGPEDKPERTPLKLDDARLDELAEGWIPILTPDGSGVLLFGNCD
jgi:hypothetical protein